MLRISLAKTQIVGFSLRKLPAKQDWQLAIKLELLEKRGEKRKKMK